MLTFDIPINIKVLATSEEEAEKFVSNLMSLPMKEPLLVRNIKEWDFIEFISLEEEECEKKEST